MLFLDLCYDDQVSLVCEYSLNCALMICAFCACYTSMQVYLKDNLVVFYLNCLAVLKIDDD